MNYRHTQIGSTLIAIVGALVLLVIVLSHLYGNTPRSLVALPVLIVCLLIFPSLTIEIRNGFLFWRFGIGIIRKKVPLSDIIRATPVTTTLLQGWGIHLTSGGWLYNVSGFQAVEFELRDGKRFRLGTDEPEELVRALSANLGH